MKGGIPTTVESWVVQAKYQQGLQSCCVHEATSYTNEWNGLARSEEASGASLTAFLPHFVIAMLSKDTVTNYLPNKTSEVVVKMKWQLNLRQVTRLL